MATLTILNDPEQAKAFLRDDKSDMPKKDLAAKYDLRVDEVSKLRARLTANGNGKHKPAKKKPAAKRKPVDDNTLLAELIYRLKQKRDRLTAQIKILEEV